MYWCARFNILWKGIPERNGAVIKSSLASGTFIQRNVQGLRISGATSTDAASPHKGFHLMRGSIKQIEHCRLCVVIPWETWMTSFQPEKNAYWRHEGELSIFADEIFPVEMASVMFLPQHSDTRGMFYLFCEITNVLRQNKTHDFTQLIISSSVYSNTKWK